jgi:glutamyl-tRNA synthetase/nondiscriminating glutamyl-tRNA synthetase
MGDLILVRSDGHPAYNFAVVIDDHQMEITHVIRCDDHISNTPRQLAVYRAFGWTPPDFAHLSTVLGPDRARLSKRHGATSLQNFREMGILPEALRNYLALLGWSPAGGETEILSTDELLAQFSLEHITKSPAVFDIRKLKWMNRQYMKQLPPAELAKRAVPFLAQPGFIAEPALPAVVGWLERVLDAVLKNLDALAQLPTATQSIFRFDAAKVLGTAAPVGFSLDDADRQVLAAFIPKVLAEASGGLSYSRFREIAQDVQQETGKTGRALFHPIRVALTGEISGPELEKLIPIFEEGAKLPLKTHVKNCAERLREFAAAAALPISVSPGASGDIPASSSKS